MGDDAPKLISAIEVAINDGHLRSLVLSQPAKRDEGDASRVDIRPVTLNSGQMFQWSRQIGTQAFHENLAPDQTSQTLQRLIGTQFRHVHLTTDDQRLSARFSRRGKCRLHREPHSPAPTAKTQHNRTRQYIIPDGQPVPFLVETGIMTAEGKVRAKHYHKFRQINRYLEFIADVLDNLPQDELIQIVDFGCGKSYLTFATHHYLTSVARRAVSIHGLDRRHDVVDSCCRIVNALNLQGIQFEHGDIADFDPTGQVHLAISLHACDTATDDALAQAVLWKTEVILAVPCCQHELNSAIKGSQIPLLAQHGILQERFCSMATDSIRAALLEQVGYQTQVLEFIDMEHTAKNLLIRAVRRPDGSEAATPASITQEMNRFCDVFQIPPLHLQRTLQEQGIPLSTPGTPTE